MINKDINDITELDLHHLIDDEVIERKTLDYKAELPGNTDSAKKEFFADVSSFSNAISSFYNLSYIKYRN